MEHLANSLTETMHAVNENVQQNARNLDKLARTQHQQWQKYEELMSNHEILSQQLSACRGDFQLQLDNLAKSLKSTVSGAASTKQQEIIDLLNSDNDLARVIQEKCFLKVEETHEHMINSKFEKMQLQFEGRIADLTQEVKTQFHELPNAESQRAVAHDSEGPISPNLQSHSWSDDQHVGASGNDVAHSITKREIDQGYSKAEVWSRSSLRAVASSLYEFDLSAYDSVVLIFSDVAYWEDSALIILTTFLSIISQLIFCNLCTSKAFTANQLPTHEAAQRWRFEIAHDMNNLNWIRETSLTSRVCSKDQALSVSDSQVMVLEQIEQWLETAATFGLESGFVMNCLAVCLWLMNIQLEVMRCFRAIIAYVGVTRGSKMSFSFEAMASDDPRLVILTMQSFRIISMVFLTLVRLSLALFLGTMGVHWLSNTLSLTDLVLNCIGLVFILDLDEVLCHLTLPRGIRWCLDRLDPLPNAVFRQRRWMRMTGPLFVICTTIVVLTIYINEVVWQVRREMLSIRDVLCGGNKDFVVVRQLGTQMFVFSRTNEASTDRFVEGNSMQQFGSWVVEGIINSGAYSSDGVWQENYSSNINATYLQSENGISQLQSFSLTSMERLSDFWGTFVGCDDLESFDVLRNPEFFYSHRERLQRLRTLEVSSGISDASNCSDFKHLCDSETLPMLRTVCPETCGCQSARAGLLYGTINAGCPVKACKRLHIHEFDEIPCRDPTPEELQEMPGWQNYWWGALDYVARNMNWDIYVEGVLDPATGNRLFRADLWNIVMRFGCNYLHLEPTAEAFCHPTVETTTLRPFCPVACGCHTSFGNECPTQCRTRSNANPSATNLPAP